MTNFAAQYLRLFGAPKGDKLASDPQRALDELSANVQRTQEARRGLRELDQREEEFVPEAQAQNDALRAQIDMQVRGDPKADKAEIAPPLVSEDEFVAERSADRAGGEGAPWPVRRASQFAAPFVDPVTPANIGTTGGGIGRGLRAVGRWINEDSLDAAPRRERPMSDGDWEARGVETMADVVVEAEAPSIGTRLRAAAEDAGGALRSAGDWTGRQLREVRDRHPGQGPIEIIGEEAADFLAAPWAHYEETAQARDRATVRGDTEGAQWAALRGLGDTAAAVLTVAPGGAVAREGAEAAANVAGRGLRAVRGQELGIREAPRAPPLQARRVPDDAPPPELQPSEQGATRTYSRGHSQTSIMADGEVVHKYQGSVVSGATDPRAAGSGEEALASMRDAERALHADIAARGLPEYHWTPGDPGAPDPRLAEFYRRAMQTRAPQGYLFSETPDGVMHLDRVGRAAREIELEPVADFTPAASTEGAIAARRVTPPDPITQRADGRPMFGADGRLMAGMDPTNPRGLRRTDVKVTPLDRGVRIKNADGTERDLAVPSEPDEWRTLMGAHPWINTPARAQLVIMASARRPNGAFRYSLDEIAERTRYATPASTLHQARNSGLLIPTRSFGANSPTAAPGGAMLDRVLATLERAAANDEVLTAKQVAERLGSSSQSVRSMLSTLRNGTSHRRPPQEMIDRIQKLDARLGALRQKLRGKAGAGVDPDTILALMGTGGYWTAVGGATAAMMSDEASAQEGPPPGAEQLTGGIGSLYLVPGEGARPSLDGAEIQSLGPERPDMAVATLADGREVILRVDGDNFSYAGEAWRSDFNPLPDDFPVGEEERPDRKLELALSGIAGLIGGRYGRRAGTRTGQPLQAQIVAGAGGGAIPGAVAGAVTPEDDMLERAAMGAGAGVAATSAGSAGREGARRLQRGLRNAPPFLLRGRAARGRGAPAAIGEQRAPNVVRPELRELQAESARWDTRAPPPSAKTPPRLRPPRAPLAQRAAQDNDTRGSLFNRLRRSPSFDRHKLATMSREAGLPETGTRTDMARRLAEAGRQNPGLLQRWKRLYPYLGIGAPMVTNQSSDAGGDRAAP